MLDKETGAEDIIEKRIKPTVIRRRAAKPVPKVTEEKQPPQIKMAEEVSEKKEDIKKVETKKEEVAPVPSKETPTPLPEKQVKPAQEVPVKKDREEEKSKKKVIREVKISPVDKQGKRNTAARNWPSKRRPFSQKRKGKAAKKGSHVPTDQPATAPEATTAKPVKKVIKMSETISVGDLSRKMGIKANEVIKKLMELGVIATINRSIDYDAASLIAHDFEFEVESTVIEEEDIIEARPDTEEELLPKSPVVTVMGHVDHGKTSLLDAIRKTSVTKAEKGGITQHIGAYHVHLDKGDVTFLDTPGHEAFTAMRARGAKVTDIVVLVVAADDGVMPQTVEAINHAKAAKVPIIVAINKIDVPDADPKRVKQALTEHDLVAEEWGGDTIFAEVSAKNGQGMKELLELILLQADVMEFKVNPNKPARDTVIESRLDKGRGPIATVLVQSGTLRIGDIFITGTYYGKVRAMISDWGEKIEKAGPSMPVEVLGLPGVTEAGESFIIVKDDAAAKKITETRHRKHQEKTLSMTSKVSLADLHEKIKAGDVKELNTLIKGDVQGSVEAVRDSIEKLKTDAVRVKMIHSAVGGISESDVMLASASKAIIIGFNVRADMKTQELAEKEGIAITFYSIIYDLTNDIKKAMEGLLEPTLKEESIGSAEVRQVFNISKVGTIAGSYVNKGKMVRGGNVHLLRDSVVIYDGRISSLKRIKDDAKEVSSGYECGIGIENFNDIKAGDVIEAYIIHEIETKL
ncbi:MAG: translation initiation factor IF-2 [Thermodesulfobacteriota bacterium]